MQLAPVLLWTVDGPLLDQAGMFQKREVPPQAEGACLQRALFFPEYCRALFVLMSTTAVASRGSYLGIRAAHKVRAHARFAKLPQELALLA